MTLFELMCLGCLVLALFCGMSWIVDKLEVHKYLSDEEIEQRIREVNKALENRPRVRAITEIKGKS
jgi:hypothetical protein